MLARERPQLLSSTSMHMDFGDDSDTEEGAITSADIYIGEKVSDGNAMTAVFERKKKKPLHVRLYNGACNHIEYFYYTHLATPDDPDSDDDDDERAAIEDAAVRVWRNRACCFVVLAALLFGAIDELFSHAPRALLLDCFSRGLACQAALARLLLLVLGGLPSALSSLVPLFGSAPAPLYVAHPVTFAWEGGLLTTEHFAARPA